MGEPPESDKPQRGNVPVQVSSALQQKLLEAFEKRYKKPGKNRARTGEFLTHWAIQLSSDAPSDQAVLNVLKGKRDTAELWLVDGLCRLLIGYPYAEWSRQPTQAQGTSPELPQLSQLGSQLILPCPYRGLDAFRKEDAPFFCGRENFIKQLEVAVRKKPLVAVIGRSGSGKSSVVFAGLIPKLSQKRGWLIRDFRPEKRPFYNLAKGLTQRILDTVIGEPGSLPLLEFALKLLWEKQSDGKLTHAAYEEIGGVDKALANHAEDVYQKLTEDEQKRVQHIFTQLVRPGAGTEDTRRLATRAEVGEDNWDLVTYLANQDARLVVTGCDEATGEATVEVVHEALIRGWERLREWMEADRKFRTWQERLRTAKDIWENSKRDEGALLRGALLIEAEDWMEQRGNPISSPEKEFIQAMTVLSDCGVVKEKKSKPSNGTETGALVHLSAQMVR